MEVHINAALQIKQTDKLYITPHGRRGPEAIFQKQTVSGSWNKSSNFKEEVEEICFFQHHPVSQGNRGHRYHMHW